MSNINDYLLWRGDVPITKECKFNEIDSMIMARLSYLRFDKIELSENETIEEASKKMQKLRDKDFLYNGDKELITNLGKSNRFKNMIISDYIKTSNKKEEEQFGAITIHISDKELYISYIGTDSTINGWKEDFNMGFMDNVPCQITGSKYAKMIAEKYPNQKIRIGGHSKGGNVAIYSAITANKKIQNRIIKVYNYDGPGFSKNIIDKYSNEKIIDKIETYIPQDSVIGRVLNHKEKTTIVHSIEKGLYQHDIYSWQAIGTEPIKLEENTKNSKHINETLDNWLDSTTSEQRKIFVDSIFELFYSTEANTFGDISASLSKSIPKILRKYGEISKDDRKTTIDMIKKFVKIYFSVIRK